ncbi:protein NEN1-like [Prosopis cineraria]|uniref:protein NEN1-like n=1 Tax=Prosopis cineraria TaxID=364024 RepID=UPI00240E9FBD|nr:protein NEN1-like [Prosopis cineraria]
MGLAEDRSEIVFFDVETTVPTRPGQGFAILEFGAILVCPKKLTELSSYSTLVRPANPSLISPLSERCNGITRDAVASAPTFAEIADTVYDLLHERIWAGHNILRFDCVRVRDAFSEINRPAPEPKGSIDSLVLLTQKFGRRAGDMKMASLATYFGLGQQTHRSLDDVRMNLEVLKHCATVLFLESSLPDVFTTNSWVSPNAITRSRSFGKSLPDRGSSNMKVESLLLSSPIMNQCKEGNDPTPPIATCSSDGSESDTVDANIVQHHFDFDRLRDELNKELIQPDFMVDERPIPETPQMSSSAAVPEACSSAFAVLKPDEIFISCLTASLVPLYRGSQRIQLLHKGFPFQLCCTDLKIRFGINPKFKDHAGRPKLNFVVDPSQSLCKVLEACDGIAQRLSLESGSSSGWRSVVTRKDGFFNYPTVRLQIPTAVCGNVAIYAAEIYQKESSGTVQRLLFSKFDTEELGSLFMPGTFVDAVFSLDPYDFQQNAGIRLVAKKLTINCK